MKSIATAAGVTAATVSLCLRDHPRIPVATRARIKALAQELGYQPNPYVATLMRLRRQGRAPADRPFIGLVCAQRTAQGWREHSAPTIRQMREGAWERVERRGYQPQEFWLHEAGMSNERFSAMLHARGIRGLLLGPVAEGDPPPVLSWEHFATVSLSVPLPTLPVATVCNDHYSSSLQVVRECHARGYRRPALVLHEGHRWRFQGRWEAGFVVAAGMLPGLAPLPPYYVTEWRRPAALVDWLKRERPDVVITPAADVLASPLRRAGLRVPQDIGLVLLACPRPGDTCSGIYQNGRLIGASAADALISMLERHERGLPEQATTLMLEGQWNEGKSLPRRERTAGGGV